PYATRVITRKPEAGFRDVGIRCRAVGPGAYVSKMIRHVEGVEDLSRIEPALPVVVRRTSHTPNLFAANEKEGIRVSAVLGRAIYIRLAIDIGAVGNAVIVELTNRKTRPGIVVSNCVCHYPIAPVRYIDAGAV